MTYAIARKTTTQEYCFYSVIFHLSKFNAAFSSEMDSRGENLIKANLMKTFFLQIETWKNLVCTVTFETNVKNMCYLSFSIQLVILEIEKCITHIEFVDHDANS